MKISTHLRAVVLLVLITLSCNPEKKSTTPLIPDIVLCGTVQFSDGCNAQLDEAIAYGIALVHHMTYDEAEQVFDKVRETDPNCFWGHWGKALTYIHPLWNDPPNEERLKIGLELSQQALKLAKTEKESAYATALASYYQDASGKPERERLKNYYDGWSKAYQANTTDLEAKAFYTLSLISVSDPADQTFKNQLKAGALAEELLTEIPDHPGAFHYIIHAYDYPGLSEKALQVANTYSNIAPEIPHALHMPSHIFTRLGMWTKSIEWNKRSAETALKKPVQNSTSMHYFHALDYLMYAYLQIGEDENALKVLEDMKTLSGPVHTHGATAYAIAASEGRYYLEHQDWKKAATIVLPMNEGLAWEKYPEFEAINHFASGLGSARIGDKDRTKKVMQRLDELKTSIQNPYWANQIEIQKNIIKAWATYTSGSKKEAVTMMKLACEQEWATQKHPITPGELLPARELFGDMLLEMGKPKEALEQYELSLTRSPQRLNSLMGAARAADMLKDAEKARSYYQKVVDLTPTAGVEHSKRQQALTYLGSA